MLVLESTIISFKMETQNFKAETSNNQFYYKGICLPRPVKELRNLFI